MATNRDTPLYSIRFNVPGTDNQAFFYRGQLGDLLPESDTDDAFQSLIDALDAAGFTGIYAWKNVDEQADFYVTPAP